MMKLINSIPEAAARVVKGNAEQLSIAQVGLQDGQGQSSSSARRKATAPDTSTFRSYPRSVAVSHSQSHSENATLYADVSGWVWCSNVDGKLKTRAPSSSAPAREGRRRHRRHPRRL
jgi:hypothetical protein